MLWNLMTYTGKLEARTQQTFFWYMARHKQLWINNIIVTIGNLFICRLINLVIKLIN